MGHLAAGLGFSPPAGLIKQTILESLSLYSYLGHTSSTLFFSNGCGNDSGVALGRVMRSAQLTALVFFYHPLWARLLRWH